MAFYRQSHSMLSLYFATLYAIFPTLKIAQSSAFFCTNKPIFKMKFNEMIFDLRVGAGFKPALARTCSTAISNEGGFETRPYRTPEAEKHFKKADY
jgi:hypothetical protein